MLFLFVAVSMVAAAPPPLNDAISRVASGQCTECLKDNCCPSAGLKCEVDGHDGSCTTCTGQYESPCGDNCCKSGQECNGGSCTIPLGASSNVAVGPNVAYFRNHNMDHSSKLAVSTDATSVMLNEWDTTINIFDSVKDVKVQRIDVVGAAGATVSLYSSAAPLALAEGPMYIFHNATKLDMIDSTGKSYSAGKTDAVSWMSKGACLHFDVTLSSQGEASLFAVTSGSVNWSPSESAAQSCNAATVLVGAGTNVGGGSGGGWVYNEVKYTLADSESCTNPLQHGANGYSQTDEPIGPLDAHFHTRGALYYNQYGQSKYNDEAAPNDTLYPSELRFVNMGVYYGPEVMDRSTCFVASVHEADPAAVNPVSESPDSECPFACMNTLDNKAPAHCTRKAKTSVVV